MEEPRRHHAGPYLLGLSTANRQAAGVVTGDEVEVHMELDTEPVSWSSPGLR
jgi:hypothetical protein